MNEEQVNYEEIDIREILHTLKTGWWIIVLFLILALSATFASFQILEPIYKAESTLFVGKESGSQIAGIDLGQFSLEQKLVADYREIVRSRLVASEVLDALKMDMSVEAFQKRVNVTTISDSRLFKISFESNSPVLARDVTNKISEVIILKAQDIMDVKSIQVIDRAELPEIPIKPNKIMNISIAGVLGLMIGIFVVLLMQFLNQTIKSPKDVEQYLHLNTLGEIPVFKGEKRKK